jgi:hypothetical protein
MAFLVFSPKRRAEAQVEIVMSITRLANIWRRIGAEDSQVRNTEYDDDEALIGGSPG